MNIDGREVLVDLECERSLEGWKPRRLGMTQELLNT